VLNASGYRTGKHVLEEGCIVVVCFPIQEILFHLLYEITKGTVRAGVFY
jgi:hypothetical protein